MLGLPVLNPFLPETHSPQTYQYLELSSAVPSRTWVGGIGLDTYYTCSVPQDIAPIFAWCIWFSGNYLRSNGYQREYLTSWVAHRIQFNHALQRPIYSDAPPEICFCSLCGTPYMSRFFHNPFYITVTYLTNHWRNSLGNFPSQLFITPVP